MTRMRRVLNLALMLALGASPGLAQTSRDGAPKGMVLDRVVAVVNDEALTLSEVQEEGQPVIRKIFQDFVGVERDRRVEEAQKRLMDDLIDRRLMYQVAKREGMLPSPSEVSSSIEELKRTNNATDDAQFRALLRAEGLTLEQIRRSIGERLAIGRLLARQIRSAIILDEDEMLKYYQDHPEQFQRAPEASIRHILVPVSRGTEEAAARALAEEALAKIRAGADFAQVARQYSGSPTRERGGDLGTVRKGELAPEIEAAAFNLPAGAVSPLIRTGAGWNLIQVDSVRTETLAPYADARESIRDRLFQEKFEARRKEWVEGLRARSFIQVLIQPGDLHADSKKP
jgi:peptidyl-prolyl cis-trans isomerase SurA